MGAEVFEGGRAGERGEGVFDLLADGGDEVGGEAEDGGHGAFAGGNGLLHVAAAEADGADGVGEGEGAGGDVGGVLAEGVAGGHSGGDAALGEHAEGCGGDGEDGGLSVFGELEGVFGTFEDELREGELEGSIGLFEDGACGGEIIVKIAAHADGLGALAGKEKSWLDCGHRERWYMNPMGRKSAARRVAIG